MRADVTIDREGSAEGSVLTVRVDGERPVRIALTPQEAAELFKALAPKRQGRPRAEPTSDDNMFHIAFFWDWWLAGDRKNGITRPKAIERLFPDASKPEIHALQHRLREFDKKHSGADKQSRRELIATFKRNNPELAQRIDEMLTGLPIERLKTAAKQGFRIRAQQRQQGK